MRHASLRLRYLISFLLLILLMAVFAVYICQSNLTMARSFSAQAALQTFTDAKNDISHILTRCEDLARTAVTSVADNNLRRDEAGHTRIRIDSQVYPVLEEILNQLDVPAEVLLYIRGDSVIYTAQEKFLYDAYVNHSKTGYKMDEAGMFTQMLRIKQPVILHIPYSSGTDQVAFLVPVRCGDGATVIISYLFSFDVLTQRFENYLGNTGSDLFIYTSAYKTIYSRTSDHERIPLSEMYRIPGSGILEKSRNDTDYILLREYDLNHSLTYTLCTEESLFYSSVHSSYTTQILTLAAVFSVLVILAFVLTKANYKPIQSLASDILGHTPPADANEVELIRTSYISSRKQMQELNAIAVSHFLNRLAENSISSRMEYDYLLLCTGITLPYDSYAVLYLLIRQSSPDIPEKTQAVCEGLRMDNCVSVAGLLNSGHAVSILICFDPASDPQGYPVRFAEEVQKRLTQNGITGVMTGVSSVCRDPVRLPNHFMEASAAVQLAPLDTDKTSSSITRRTGKHWIPPYPHASAPRTNPS